MSTTTTVFTQASRNNSNGTSTTATRAVPTGFDSATVRIDCTTGNQAAPFTGFQHPFNSPSMDITFGVQWSWDGGATFPASTQGDQVGSATGIWGTDKAGNPIMAPTVDLGMPFDAARGGSPTHYRAYMTVAGGPITFGFTVFETTG